MNRSGSDMTKTNQQGEHDAPTLTTAVLATPEAGPSALFMIVDVLSSVGRDWQLLHDQPPRKPRFSTRIVSIDGKPLSGLNEVWIKPHGSLSQFGAPDLVIVPDLMIIPDQPLPAHYEPVAEWVSRASAAGAIVASVCSGALLLAKAGLLQNLEATTHWAYCDMLARQHPEVTVRKERVLIPAGPEHRIITSGGGSALSDLLLYLVARLAGPQEALRIAKLYLLQGHHEGQLPFAMLSAGRQHEDRVVAEVQLWLADNYAGKHPVAAMVRRAGLSERTFHRRFLAATGQAPIAYVQSLRIEEAKHLLETTDLGIDEIGAEVGYLEPASFRRVFRKLVGVSPSIYRRRFQPLFRLTPGADDRAAAVSLSRGA
jgi:transcriptional regulator GlxA family with amidase domain